jgi:hypothetical protein
VSTPNTPDSRGRVDEPGTSAHVRMLLAEVQMLRRALNAARMRAADLEAAGRATLAAERDGEADPLFYLRDELAAWP